jgi:predicted TIM-barrel fold metal-dependent hydrolase
LDDNGIERAFLYPTALGNVSRVREPAYAVALCEAYNDYVYDHYTNVSPRLSPIALLPPQDPERAAIELRRAVRNLGCRGTVVRTTGLRLPLGHRFYDPIYREAESLGCALAVHGTNGAEELASGAFETFTEVHIVSFPVGIFVQFTSMIFQGVPMRFPRLRLAFLEIGCTWLPYWLDRMDEHWEKRGKIETPSLIRLPSQCVREQPIYFSCEPEEKLLPETLRYVGESHFVYASDIPHWDAEFPQNLHLIQDRKDLSDEAKRKLLYENAKILYDVR